MRRRFFPSRAVQRIPGPRVALGMQVHPSAPAAPVQASGGACACDVAGVALLPDFIGHPWYEEGRRAVASTDQATAYAPVFEGWRLVSTYVDIPAPWDEWGAPLTMRAVVIGSTTCSVDWTWVVDVPELPPGAYGSEGWWDGVELQVQDGTLLITVLQGDSSADWYAPPWWATVTATATCAGVPVGSVTLMPGFQLENLESENNA